MPSCRGDDKCPLRLLLSVDRREIYSHRRPRKCRYIELFGFLEKLHAREHIDDVMETLHGDHIDVGDHGCLRNIRFREKYIRIAELSCEDSRRKGSLDSTHHAIEGELTEK